MSNIDSIVRLLRKRYGTWKRERNSFQVLIYTILSQRTRDANTDVAARQLFSRYKNPQQISDAPVSSIERLIRPSGFYKVKAKRLKEVSRKLLADYRGKVPRDFEELLALPGVGRKTANCVLVYGFGIPAIPVDTHVHRISNRLGIVKTKTPEQTEKALAEFLPRKYWGNINSLLVQHGQTICLPRNPKCDICSIKRYCSYYKIIFSPSRGRK
jgi:endonuclease-3